MPNNENYEKCPSSKLTALLSEFGWEEVEKNVWEKDVRLLVDTVGIFLFRWLKSEWVRTHGLAHASLCRIARTREIIFADGAKLNLEGQFAPAKKKMRRPK